jgi:hypothetical protein
VERWERDFLLRFKGVGRCVIGWHLGFELGRGASEGTLQFAQGTCVKGKNADFPLRIESLSF